MVQLHAIEHGLRDVRATRDVDVLGQPRPPGALESIDAALREDGFELSAPDLEGYGYRYERGGLIVDVLAPDGLSAPPRLGGGVAAVGIPGGSQALERSERVSLAVGAQTFTLNRPTLFVAILIKARSLMVHGAPASQREDLLLLLSLVDDPRRMSDELRMTERRWLRDADERLAFAAPSLLDRDAQTRAEQAFMLLTRE
jgi:hypothetical protein